MKRRENTEQNSEDDSKDFMQGTVRLGAALRKSFFQHLDAGRHTAYALMQAFISMGVAMGIVRRFLFGILAFQIAFGGAWTGSRVPGAQAAEFVAYSPAPNWAVAGEEEGGDHPDSASLDDAADRLEKGELNDRERDPHHLRAQKVFIKRADNTFTEYDLSRLEVSVPRIAFDELRTRIVPQLKQLWVEAYAGGQLVGYQAIGDFEVIAQARDGEFFSFVDREGRLYSADFGFWFKRALSHALPTTELVTHEGLGTKGVSLAYVTPGLNPNLSEATIIPTGLNGPEVKAGDIALQVDGKIVGIYSRDVAYQRMIRGFELLAVQGVIVSPETAPEALVNEVFGGILNEEARAKFTQTANGLPSEIHPEALAALTKVDTKFVELLVNRLKGMRAQAANPRDQRTVEQWKDDFQALRHRMREILQSETLLPEEAKRLSAALAADDLGNYWRKELVPNDPKSKMKSMHEKVTSGGMKAIAAATVLGGAGTAYAYGVQGHGPEVMVGASNWVYSHLIPDVMKVAEFQFPLWASVTSMTLVVPFLFWIVPLTSLPVLQHTSKGLALLGQGWTAVVEKLAELGKTAGFEKLSKGAQSLAQIPGVLTRRAFETVQGGIQGIRSVAGMMRRYVTLGVRLFAVCNYAAFRIAAQTFGQPAFIDALKNGRAPWKTIEKESELGKQLGLDKDIRLGLNFPAWGKEADRVKTLRLQAQAALDGEELRLRETARVLAALVVSHELDVSPSALLLVAREGGVLDALRDAASTPEGRRTLADLSLAYEQSLNRTKLELLDGGLDRMSDYRLLQEIESLQALAKGIQGKEWWVRLKAGLSHVVWSTNRKLWSWGEYQSQLLLRTMPDDFSYKTILRDSATDIVTTGGVMALFGARADLSKPHNLSFLPDGSVANLWTRAPHWGDTVGNIETNVLLQSAQTTLQRSQEPPVEESNYRPREEVTHQSVDRSPGYLRSFFKYILDLRPTESDLGMDFWRTFTNRFATIQAVILINLSVRYFVGGQALQGALMAEAFVILARIWTYGWVWNPVHVGNKAHGRWIASGKKEFEDAKTRLSQDLETGRNAEASAEAMREMFERDWRAVSNKLINALKIAESLFAAEEADRALALEELRKNPEMLKGFQESLARLAVATQHGRKEEAKTIAREVAKYYSENGIPEPQRMSPRTLLDFSIAHPPVYNKELAGLMIASTFLLGGAMSTYLYSNLSVLSYEAEKLGWADYGQAAMYAAAFHATTFVLLGQKAWNWALYERNPDGTPREQIGPDGVRQKVPRVYKGWYTLGASVEPVRPMNWAWRTCSRMLSNFDARRSLLAR